MERQLMAMEVTAMWELDSPALEQILVGHKMATCGEANQVFLPTSTFDYWIGQPVDVWLVILWTEERTGGHPIRWMNVTRYLKNRKDKECRQIVDVGDPLTSDTVEKLCDNSFPRC